jgi:hypothetical protein
MAPCSYWIPARVLSNALRHIKHPGNVGRAGGRVFVVRLGLVEVVGVATIVQDQQIDVTCTLATTQ